MSANLSALSLRPWPQEELKDESITNLIGRIYQQRGPFRHITEDALKQEIRNKEAGGPGKENEDNGVVAEAEVDDELDINKKRDQVFAAKAEILQCIKQAENEALTVRDFVSLLLSKDDPRRASMSMSPALKQMVPEGTLSYDKWPVTQPAQAELRKRELVAKGWRMQNLSAAADSLLSAATRLEKEVKKETTYWEQVLSVSEKPTESLVNTARGQSRRWSVCRSPRERHVLGVRFGFIEASAQFRERGFASLRVDENGSVYLDQGPNRTPQTIRVRIIRNGVTVGTSKKTHAPTTPTTSLEDSVRQARDSLFDEELFHEMTMETRVMLSYDVKMRDSSICLPMIAADRSSLTAASTERDEILIDLIPPEEATTGVSDQPSDPLADYIAVVLRLLLSHAHRQRLQRRSQPPPPLSDRKQPSQPPAILRPLLNHLQHHTAHGVWRAYFETIASIFHSAGIPLNTQLMNDTMQNIESFTTKAKPSQSKPGSSASTINDLVSSLAGPLASTAAISLPSSNLRKADPESLVIEMRTRLGPPGYGTEYTLNVPDTFSQIIYPGGAQSMSSRPKQFTFTSFSQLTRYMNHLLAIDLTHVAIAAEHEGWEGNDFVPEVSKTSDVLRRRKRIGVRLGDGRLSVYWKWADRRDKAKEYNWTGEEGRMGFREVVEEYIKDSGDQA